MGTVSYKNQPAIDTTKGHVPLAGTEHPYRVLKVLWPPDVERFVASLLVGRSLHVCCGKSKLGTVRLDIDEANAPDILCDARDMSALVSDGEYETVLCDPPYNGDMQWNHDLLRELVRVASRRIIFQHWFIPADDNGRYRKARDGWGLSALYAWMPRTYFGRAQMISVFDYDNRQPTLFLESLAIPPLPAAPSAICGNCKHFEPYRDSQTGRVHPSKQGRCACKPNIKWPMAYRRTGYGWREQDPMVYPVGVWKDTDARTCACFSLK